MLGTNVPTNKQDKCLKYFCYGIFWKSSRVSQNTLDSATAEGDSDGANEA